MDRCVASRLVSSQISTASGLHLGQTEPEVTAIRGKPNSPSKTQLTYWLSVRKQVPATELEKLRSAHPELSEKDFKDNYALYDLNAGALLRLADSKVTYIAITMSETN